MSSAPSSVLPTKVKVEAYGYSVKLEESKRPFPSDDDEEAPPLKRQNGKHEDDKVVVKQEPEDDSYASDSSPSCRFRLWRQLS